jgi:gluconolactonase
MSVKSKSMSGSIPRRGFCKVMGGGILGAATMYGSEASAMSKSPKNDGEQLYDCKELFPPGRFTRGMEGPCVAPDGTIYCVALDTINDIGMVTPDGQVSKFLNLPDEGAANGIRINSEGKMFIADYKNHNIFKVDIKTKKLSLFAHEPKMNQPNDLAIRSDNVMFATDPNWGERTGQLWRIDTDGSTTLLDGNLHTTNGIDLSPDEKILYINQSFAYNILAFDLSPEGNISNKREIINFADDISQDGMRIDCMGNLYTTRHGKGVIAKVNPQGKILQEIHVANGLKPSNICFGGSDGCTAYMTHHDTKNIQYFRVEHPGRNWMLYKKWGLI